MQQSPEAKSKRAIFLLPNFFTTSGLFAGFYAIIAGMKGHFEVAAFAIFIAVIMDSMDGRVARLTGSESAFGKEYDSLSDMVAFGVAPALVCYVWGLNELGKIGWLAAFFYTATTALRLARFNVQESLSKAYFQGLPSPGGAATIAALVSVITDFEYHTVLTISLVAGTVVVIGLLMVSNIPYYSFKELDLKHKVPFVATFALVLLFVAVSYDPPKVIFGLLTLYVLHGPLIAIKRLLFKRRNATT